MTAPLPLAFFATPGPSELLLVFLAILILFGARRLPEIAKMLGKTVEELRRASRDFRDQIMRGDEDPGPGPQKRGSLEGEPESPGVSGGPSADVVSAEPEPPSPGGQEGQKDGVDTRDLAG